MNNVPRVEVEGWTNDPEEWQATPPLDVFGKLYARDPSVMERVSHYDLVNLVEDSLGY